MNSSNSYVIYGLDDNTAYSFLASSPYNAMEMMLYYLNLRNRDDSARIKMTNSAQHLYLDHDEKTYAIKNS